MGARLHQVGDAAAVARAFNDEIGNERDRFRIVELDAPLQPAPRNDAAMAISSLSFSRGVRFMRAPIRCRQRVQTFGTDAPPRKAEMIGMRIFRKAKPSLAETRATSLPCQ